MAGNSIGQVFRVMTAGESHGLALTAIVDGVPPGIALTEADLQGDLDRRKPGTSSFATQRKEEDQVKILSGVFEGRTTGTPIALVIENTDQRSKDYGNIADTFRPAHADYTYTHKFGFRDYRGGGRSSARETAMRVAAGAIARKVLAEQFGVSIRGRVSQIGDIKAQTCDWDYVRENPFFCGDRKAVPKMEQLVLSMRTEGSSIGAAVEVFASGMPVGWGEPVFDRLDADIAHAMMSINAVKGVEIGDGFAVVAQRGEQHAGGVLGGISSGQDLIVRIALKPTSSITTPGRSINLKGEAIEVVTKGRHDPCVGVRATPIAEAMLAIVLLDHALRHRAQNAMVTCSTPVIPGSVAG